jgi:hypothetical protein
MKHIVAALILALIVNLTHATRPQAPKRTQRCQDISLLHGASVFVR